MNLKVVITNFILTLSTLALIKKVIRFISENISSSDSDVVRVKRRVMQLDISSYSEKGENDENVNFSTGFKIVGPNIPIHYMKPIDFFYSFFYTT